MPDIDKLELVPPHSIEAEQVLLGALFLDKDYFPEIREILNGAEDFYRRAHQLIYVEMSNAYNAGESVDWVVVGNRLDKSGLLEDVGGLAYLDEITTRTPVAEGAEQYAAIVRDKATFRRIIAATTRMRTKAYDPTANVESLLSSVQKFADTLAGFSQTDIPSMGLLYDALEEQAREAFENKVVPGWETGHPALQEKLLGWQIGAISALAAPSGGGKTFFAFELLNLFLHRNPELTGAFITMEMQPFEIGSRQIVGDRFLSQAAMGEDVTSDYHKVKNSIDRFRQRGRMQIAKPHSDSIEAVKDLIRSLAQRGHKFIVWDYIGLADFEGRSAAEAASKHIPKLKDLAERYGIHLMILSQINKKSQDDSAIKFDKHHLYGNEGSHLTNAAHSIFSVFQLHTQEDDPLCREIYSELLDIPRHTDAAKLFAADEGERGDMLWPKEVLRRLVIQKVVKGRRGARRFWAFWLTERDNRLKPLYYGYDELTNARVRSLEKALNKSRTYRRKR